VAGRALPAVSGILGGGPGLDTEAVPQVTLLAERFGGVEVMSERTADPGLHRQAQVRRLMALVLRAARHRGEAAVFEPNSPRTWRDVAMALTGILRNLHSAGALDGVREEDAFEVRCDRSTMSQQDIDLGRMIAEVRLRPAASLEMIDVVLVLRGGDGLRGAA
jgi:phage tail sheath protein FI